MGQTAGGGIQASPLPVGYQPAEFPSIAPKVNSSLSLYDEDGTWGRPPQRRCPSPPPSAMSSASCGGGSLLRDRLPATGGGGSGGVPYCDAASDRGFGGRLPSAGGGGGGGVPYCDAASDGGFGGRFGSFHTEADRMSAYGGFEVGPGRGTPGPAGSTPFASQTDSRDRDGAGSMLSGYEGAGGLGSGYSSSGCFESRGPGGPAPGSALSTGYEGRVGASFDDGRIPGCGSGLAGVPPRHSAPGTPQRDGLQSSSFDYGRPPPLAVTCAVPATPKPPPPPGDWDVGSILEVYSATAGIWYPARVMQVQQQGDNEVLTVQFYADDEAKQKSVYRTDAQLARLGTNTAGQLPLGFVTKASSTRPGQLVYMDATTGVKYGTPELAWQVHFERLLQRPVAGCETVCAMPGPGRRMPPTPTSPTSSIASAHTHLAPRSCGEAQAALGGSGATRPISLAELQAVGPNALSALTQSSGDHLQQSLLRRPACSETSCGSDIHDLTTSGKIALPSFGDAIGSQAAYLRYEGKAGAEEAEFAAQAEVRVLPATTAVYPTSRGAAPRKPPPAPRNPALQVWQEDPFSEWRR